MSTRLATELSGALIAVLLLATVLLTRHGRQLQPSRPRNSERHAR